MCHARIACMCSVCRARVIFYRRLHTRLKSLIDMQAYAHAVFANAATRTQSFFTCDNTHMQFINTHALSYASAYQPIAIVYT